MTLVWLAVLVPRAGLLSTTTAALLYLTLLERGRVQPVLALFPAIAVCATAALIWNADRIADHLSSDWSFIARLQSSRIALASLAEHPLFGFGTSSYYSVSYQDVFGRHFYPGDIGLLGVVFRNGLLGAGFYLAAQLHLTGRCVRTVWIRFERTGRAEPVLSMIAVLFIALTFMLPIQPALAFNFGFPVVGLALGFASIARSPAREESFA